jgi:MFS family permease
MPAADSDGSSILSSPASSISSTSRHQRRRKAARRSIAFVTAVCSALCAGSITVFSLYGHIFQERLRYTQLQVNGVAIGSSVALYLPVSLFGYVCDRFGTKPLSVLAAALFGVGYGLAAVVYRSIDQRGQGRHNEAGRSYPLMVFAFVCIGVATCAMYLSAVATCAKNFGKGRHRGLALAMPIAGFGLSGMWLSQVGSRLFCETRPDGSRGDVDVFRFFVFLAVLLVVVGVVGIFALRVVDENDLIEEAIEELEHSGLLDGRSLLARRHSSDHGGYGAIQSGSSAATNGRTHAEDADLLDPAKDLGDDDDAQWKKNWVLNAETRRFLSDKTMWLFAIGFLLMIGPGEAFINNLGTVIGTLYPPAAKSAAKSAAVPTSAATHVSIVGITSTVARLLTGTLTDLLAPCPQTQHVQVSATPYFRQRFTVSRLVFLVGFGILLSLGLLALASGLMQNHGERFWIVSSLVGAGYGAVFSLTPIIITVIWGVENFATNWGIVATFPALGSTFWGLVYSKVYENGAKRSATRDEDIFCYGKDCYAPTFWAMTLTVWIACLFVLWAWKGRGGWSQRGIVI